MQLSTSRENADLKLNLKTSRPSSDRLGVVGFRRLSYIDNMNSGGGGGSFRPDIYSIEHKCASLQEWPSLRAY